MAKLGNIPPPRMKNKGAGLFSWFLTGILYLFIGAVLLILAGAVILFFYLGATILYNFFKDL